MQNIEQTQQQEIFKNGHFVGIVTHKDFGYQARYFTGNSFNELGTFSDSSTARQVVLNYSHR